MTETEQHLKREIKIFHTADIHLDDGHEHRWDALQNIIVEGIKQEIDLLIITGDLFNEGMQINKFQSRLSKMLNAPEVGFNTIILPGNHDPDYLNLFFGEKVQIYSSDSNPQSYFPFVDIWGLPFSENWDEEKTLSTLKSMQPKMDPSKVNLLLYHGNLQGKQYESTDAGEEGNSKYMPMHLESFAQFPFDYVLAGHIHVYRQKFSLNSRNNRFFIYSGSPVSITRKENTPREVNLLKIKPIDSKNIETEEARLDKTIPSAYTITDHPYPINTFHYIEHQFQIPIEDPQQIYGDIDEFLKGDSEAKSYIIEVEGIFNQATMNCELSEFLGKVRSKFPANRTEITPNINDYTALMNHQLYQKVSAKIIASIPEEKEQAMLTRLLMKSMSNMVGQL